MSKVKYHYTATISQRSEDMTGLGGGTLIVGITYIIGIYSEGDDFSNIANVISGDINKTGCIFIATGTNPTNWTNGTLIRSYGNPWATFLDSNLENPTWKYITDNRYYLQTNKLIDPVKTSVNMGIRVDIEETDEPITSSYFFSDNFTVNSLFNSGVNSDPNGFNDKKTHAINEHPTVLDIIPFKEVYKGEVVEGIIIGGIFDSYLGDTCFCLVKLKSDGSIFSNFNGGIDYTGRGALGPNHRYTFQVRSIKPQRDGKLLIGGVIGSYNGTDIVSCLIRINTDETLDTTFKVDGFDGITDLVNTIAIQNDGKILVGGEFNSYDGYRSGSIIRLNSDGTVDNTFNNQNIGFNDSVNIIVIQQDGKILVGGQFDNYNDEYCAYLVRLNSNGSLDTTFMSKYDNIFDGDVNKIVIESDGSILVGGDFSGQLIRFNSDGTINNNFTLFSNTVNNTVNSLCVQSDDRILVGFSRIDDGTTAFRRFDKYCVVEDLVINCDGIIGTVLEKDGMIYFGGDFSTIIANDTYSSNCIFSLDSTTKFNLRTSKENFDNLSLDIKIYD